MNIIGEGILKVKMEELNRMRRRAAELGYAIGKVRDIDELEYEIRMMVENHLEEILDGFPSTMDSINSLYKLPSGRFLLTMSDEYETSYKTLSKEEVMSGLKKGVCSTKETIRRHKEDIQYAEAHLERIQKLIKIGV